MYHSQSVFPSVSVDLVFVICGKFVVCQTYGNV